MPTLTLKDVKTLSGETTTITLPGPKDEVIEGGGKLVALPALIDPHVHFRTPGQTYKEDFMTGAKAALAGGVTRVFDMPDNEPPTATEARLDKKALLIQDQLREVKIPLRTNLFFGADEKNIEEIPRVKKKIVGVKVFMCPSTGNLMVDSDRALSRVFEICAEEELIVAVHAEDQKMIAINQDLYKNSDDVKMHSLIRSRDAAVRATQRALYLAEEFSTEVYFCHVSTKEEIELIREAKYAQQLVWLEVAPQHLFLSEEDYAALGTRAQMNPPLRTKQDQWALWEAVIDGTADTIGTDHSPHTLQEKSRPFPQSPSGIPGIETRLPLLLNAASEGKLSLNRIIELCRTNIESIFQIETNQDYVLVDLSLEKTVEDANQRTKCGWSPYSGKKLRGWPLYTILKGEAFRVG